MLLGVSATCALELLFLRLFWHQGSSARASGESESHSTPPLRPIKMEAALEAAPTTRSRAQARRQQRKRAVERLRQEGGAMAGRGGAIVFNNYGTVASVALPGEAHCLGVRFLRRVVLFNVSIANYKMQVASCKVSRSWWQRGHLVKSRHRRRRPRQQTRRSLCRRRRRR